MGRALNEMGGGRGEERDGMGGKFVTGPVRVILSDLLSILLIITILEFPNLLLQYRLTSSLN